VWIVERGEHLRFTPEAREPIRVVRDERRQHFQRDVTVELGVVSAVDLAHAARADERIDRVRSDACALG
jgi:putative heme degradation protein